MMQSCSGRGFVSSTKPMLILSILAFCSLQSSAIDDVRQARQALVDLHPGVYRYTSEDTFEQAWRAAEVEAAQSKDDLELLGILLKAVASVRCGHTGVVLQGKSLELAREAPMMPLQLLVSESGLQVVKGFGSASGLKGAQIASLNDVPADELSRKLADMAPKDGMSLGGARFALQAHRSALYLHLLGVRSPYNVLLGDGRKAKLEGVPLREMLGQFAPPPLNGQTGFSVVGDVGVMRLVDFVSGPGGSGLSQFYDDIVARLEQQRIKFLVIDIRGNGGGYDNAGRDLVARLVKKPFTYYSEMLMHEKAADAVDASEQSFMRSIMTKGPNGSWRGTGHPNWGVNQPAPNTFDGELVVLTDGGTFSTASEFAAHVKSLGRGRIVGEETGGNYSGNTSGFVTSVRLRNSGLVINVPLVEYRLDVKPLQSLNRGVLPDVAIPVQVSDFGAREDRVLAKAVELVAK